ncbi:PepSY domain-containing protein [Sulfoacidibacillus thermotolerans]|uniref:PepSY domain-containing protein n=1 Tax=Sulfoacidibacillus thermotolerans TaxID=1765684 RepID=A0A2U3D9H8_SULT2|nr:PepSY domain-containing protein [Sulfoacidibacillus thermotolerans]PWI57925.1 hypothetical protein BM613_05785 [Sulfoacidibacillus thermotolerans]
MTLKFSVPRTRNIFQMTFLSTALFVLFAAPSHASEMRPSTPPGRPEPVRIESSVQVNQETVIKAAKAGREAYSQVLSPYAKISADVAKKAALERFPGTECKDVSLHAVRHNLVYLVLVENSEVRHLVIVDAGNGKPLAVRSVSVRSHMTSARHI